MATIVTREFGATAKGSPLTNQELDNNFINLNSELGEKVKFKAAVKVASTTNLSLSGILTIDGVASINPGDRVLVKDQTTSSQNGIYVVGAGAWTRASDADTIAELAQAIVQVDQGTLQGGDVFKCSLRSTDTLGTTACTWSKFIIGNLGTLNLPTAPTSGRGLDLDLANLGTITIPGGNINTVALHALTGPGSTITAGSASTYTRVATLYVNGAPDIGANVTATNSFAAIIDGKSLVGAGFHMSPGTATLPAARFDATGAVLLTAPTQGSMEIDSSGSLYYTDNTTVGRGAILTNRGIFLSANGTNIAAGPANFFQNANQAGIQLEAGQIYEITCFAYFAKTTQAGTATFQWVMSSAPTYIRSRYDATAIAGFTTAAVSTAAVTTAQVVAGATATVSHAASGSLSAANHIFEFRVIVRTNAAANIRLQVSTSLDGVQPLAGSWMTARKMHGNLGVLTA